ncbi:alpha/beta fold hydrolase [Profundibacterium mesophilum]|uniref:Adenylate kinase n=1 Tax=Profundibacterium mesophilum KAUST100406-0324 TaxID=1037889 RepID=A0A921NWD6_9RHOB|nr:alpha/beta fold hydrolase [Profundibacterium mesophilum]KAF0676893.1 adenylate kinase [Profundibacterium mesophilum KAUST100406-0324]
MGARPGAVDLTMIRHDGGGDAPPLLIAHGLFGSARNWGVIAKRLSDRGPVIAVDMRNHGHAPHSDAHDYEALASDLARVLEKIGPADLLGHSMGGKAAMALALLHPDALHRLVVADIAPVAYGHSQAHLIEAMKRIDLGAVTRRADADAALAAHIETASLRAFLLQSLDLADKRWRFNLDTLEREMARITGWPGIPGEFARPTLFLTGAKSDYVLPEHRPAIRAQFPKARFAKLTGAGHWLHAERPRAFEASVRAFLDA